MQLKDYWPRFLSELFEFQEIAEAEQPEFTLAVHDIEEAADDFFLVSLSDYGCSRWERIMGLTAPDTMPLEERRTQILLKYLSKLPYTETMLKQYLYTLFGEDVVANVYHDDYAVEVGYTGDQTELFASLYRELRQMVPANMTFEMYEMMALYGQLYTGVVLQIADKIVII